MVGSLARIAVFASVLFGLVMYALFTQEPGETHRSLFSKSDLFDKAYEDSLATPISEPVSALLVNHHLLAGNLIAEAFEGAKHSNPDIVILLSPNHFNAGRGQIITSNRDWSTPYGIVSADKKFVSQLTAAGVANLDYVPFEKEHGVSGIVPFIKNSFPRARIVPIIFKTTVRPYMVDALVEELKKQGGKTLIVASIDMSHYVAEEVAIPQDEEVKEVLFQRDLSKVWDLKIDSPPSMYALLKLNDRKIFNLLRRSSSAAILGDIKPADNTSYITGYFE